jgi:hypothetical protein
MTNLSLKMEKLAAEIGENIYIDVAKWHLYLADAHLHIPLTQKVYPLLEDDCLTETKVTEILKDISVTLGGGKLIVKLFDLIPETGIKNLMNLLQDYQENI